jgi:hypothetical protein
MTFIIIAQSWCVILQYREWRLSRRKEWSLYIYFLILYLISAPCAFAMTIHCGKFFNAYYYMFTYTYIAVKIKRHGQTSAKNNRISLLCTVIFVYQLANLFVIWKIRKLEKKSVIRYLFFTWLRFEDNIYYHFALTLRILPHRILPTFHLVYIFQIKYTCYLVVPVVQRGLI